ncbi:hypothetical protein BC940DRAFT_305965 [Gongronella butleri]|nr:hypothetical protein BC940DRAFT_305965 [Gongronella butleri]
MADSTTTAATPASDKVAEQLRAFLGNQGFGGNKEDSMKFGVTVVNALRDAACCSRCALRFVRCYDLELYTPPIEVLDQAMDTVGERSVSVGQCSVCLGVLQYAETDAVVQPMIECLKARAYDTNTYTLSLTFPISLLTRERLMQFHIQAHLDAHLPSLAHLWGPITTVVIKEPMRTLVSERFSQLTGKQFDPDSPLRISVTTQHEPSVDDHLFLTETEKHLLVVRKVRKKGITKLVGTSRNMVADALNKLTAAEAHKLTTVPLPSHPEKFTVSVTSMHDPVHTGGRYLKFSRECSQTPWVVRGQKLADISVSECIMPIFQKHHQCKGVKFTTAGREDANVRMLGHGRPFFVELSDPVRTVLPLEEYKQMEDEINNAPTKDIVQVRLVSPIKATDINLIKDGEESKRKTYQALVWVSSPVTDELISKCNELGSKEIEVSQHTPVRVTQRRAMMERRKLIHSMTMRRASEDLKDAHFAVIQLNTQAGTYIKEFVHGDLGRSMPNLSSLLGIEAADLLELDVMEVDLAWPPVYT